ncbi:hypothetical protein BBI01_10585 [Chryseobacterium artocarpi]|uniref:Beta-lactamase-inhibitor-like PepSY-like domain-containing protein n=1 Tax=Chryseobacterium artocarpi TaxID=1414727 RepID=A0A1B8ZLR2_9FLAO|nr:hypothetical protein [Chryseobacterium artocarpi]OCA72552.1 hypothetical protein BBI01_10585 [Chryseobacterium artocarpi]
MKFTYWGKGLLAGAMVLAVSTNSVFANERPTVLIENTQNDSDSLKIENLAKELKKMKPIAKADFKAKFKKEVAGFTLTEVTAFEDKETGSGSYATANYKKGDKNVYLMVTDGAGAGAETVKTNLLSYLDIKTTEEPGDKTNIKPYKGWQVFFDSSMYESDDMTSIQYLEGNRFSVIASGNMILITDLKAFLDNISL